MVQLVPKILTAPLTSFKQMARFDLGSQTSLPAPGPNPALQFGKVVALEIDRGIFATGGGGGRDLPCHGRYLSDHGSGQIFTVLDSLSSSVVSSISGLATQHRVEIAIPILL